MSIAIIVLFTPPDTDKPLLERIDDTEIHHKEISIYEFREHLTSVVVAVDISILLLVSIFAYFFAKRTLRPIVLMHEKQEKFMGDVAHELRTPLSVMQVGAETMLRQQRTSDQYQDFIVDVQSEAERLTRLSNQLLELLRAKNNVTNVTEVCDISAVCTKTVDRFASYAKEHLVTIDTTIEEKIQIVIDKDTFTQLLQNVIKNAIDYNIENGTVMVQLRKTAQRIELTITDTGVGIQPEKQELIFNRFQTLDTARTHGEQAGTGLGLAIVKEIVTKLKGSIKLESELGVGTIVMICLPLNHS